MDPIVYISNKLNNTFFFNNKFAHARISKCIRQRNGRCSAFSRDVVLKLQRGEEIQIAPGSIHSKRPKVSLSVNVISIYKFNEFRLEQTIFRVSMTLIFRCPNINVGPRAARRGTRCRLINTLPITASRS